MFKCWLGLFYIGMNFDFSFGIGIKNRNILVCSEEECGLVGIDDVFV